MQDVTHRDREDSYRWLDRRGRHRLRRRRSATCGPRPATATRARSPTRSTTARPTTVAACTATPACRTTATRCLSTAARSTADGHRHRSRQGRAHLLRAHAVFQTPTTDFIDHADALETSCADLVVGRRAGDRSRALHGSPEDATPAPLPARRSTAADCDQVTEHDRRGRAAHRAGAVQLHSRCCEQGGPVAVRLRVTSRDRVDERRSRTASPAGRRTPRSSTPAAAALPWDVGLDAARWPRR